MFGIIFSFFIVILLLFKYVVKRKTLNSPPEPKGIPIFGHLFQMDYMNMHETLDKWSKKYGEIFQFKVPGQTLVSLNSASVLRDVFLLEPNATISSARPPTFFGKYALDSFSDVAFASMNTKWTKMRKLTYRFIRSYGEGLVYIENQITHNLRHMKTEINSVVGKSVDPEIYIGEFLLSTVETLIVGRCYGPNGELQILLKKLDYNFNTLSNLSTDVLYSSFPFLRFFPLRNSRLLKDFLRQKKELMDLLAKIAKENPEYKGIYQSLMEATEERDREGNQWFTETNVRATLMNLVSAAFNTTRGTLLSAIHILATRPNLQKSLQEEVDKVVGKGREPTLHDRNNCPLIESFLLETLRYISHVPLSVFHATSDECVINGYHIEKGTTIIPNLWTAHHNDKEWERPFEFFPERFLDESKNLLPATHQLRKNVQAFGIGKRSCIGEVFARSRMFLFMSSLMQAFNIQPPDDDVLMEFTLDDLTPGLVMQPKPYRVKFVSRE